MLVVSPSVTSSMHLAEALLAPPVLVLCLRTRTFQRQVPRTWLKEMLLKQVPLSLSSVGPWVVVSAAAAVVAVVAVGTAVGTAAASAASAAVFRSGAAAADAAVAVEVAAVAELSPALSDRVGAAVLLNLEVGVGPASVVGEVAANAAILGAVLGAVVDDI